MFSEFFPCLVCLNQELFIRYAVLISRKAVDVPNDEMHGAVTVLNN